MGRKANTKPAGTVLAETVPDAPAVDEAPAVPEIEAPAVDEAPAVPEVETPAADETPETWPVEEREEPRTLSRVTAGRGLNLRAGPGPGFQVHTVLAEGEAVEVLKLWSSGPQGAFEVRVPGWEYIFTRKKIGNSDSDGAVGWVDSRFLAAAGPEG